MLRRLLQKKDKKQKVAGSSIHSKYMNYVQLVNTYTQFLTKGLYSNIFAIGKEWFFLVETLIFVGVLRILADKVVGPEKFVVIAIYLISHFIWFFYCLSVVVSILNKNKVSKMVAQIIGGLVGLLLSYILNTVATQIASV